VADSGVVNLFEKDEALVKEAEISRRLVSDIRAGDENAVREMIDRYSRGIRFILGRRTRDPDLVEEILQETFTIAWIRVRDLGLEQDERLAGYLRGIALNLYRKAVRRDVRQPVVQDPEMIPRIPDPGVRPIDEISSDQTRDAVLQLLESMRVPRDRDLLIRFYIYDQDKDQICRELGLGNLHFNRVLFRAKARFRKLLESTPAFPGQNGANDV